MEHLTEAELQAWIDREIDPEERAGARGHLEACAACRAELRVLQAAAETFSAAMLRYDEDLAPSLPASARLAANAARSPGPAGRAGGRAVVAVPRWAGRAAAVVLLLGAAAAAAMVPGSPFRDLFVGSEAETPPLPPIVEMQPADPAANVGASITVRPRDGRLTVRVSGFAPGTRVLVGLTDRPEAVASLPDEAPHARFIVEAGAVEVVGDGADPVGEAGEAVDIRLPRSLRAGVVELDGDVIARVRDGRLITLRQASRTEAEAEFEVGG